MQDNKEREFKFDGHDINVIKKALEYLKSSGVYTEDITRILDYIESID